MPLRGAPRRLVDAELDGGELGAPRADPVARTEFVAPDALLLHPSPAALLLVDEAAAIPTPLLERMLAHHARIVFATTGHG